MLCARHTVGNHRAQQRFDCGKHRDGHCRGEELADSTKRKIRKLGFGKRVRYLKMAAAVGKASDGVCLEAAECVEQDCGNSRKYQDNKASRNFLDEF